MYNSSNKRSKEIWDYLDGISIIANVPLTYPPKKINGLLISGMETPSIDSEFTYPKELKNEIISLFPNYLIELNWELYKDKKNVFIQDLIKMTQERINLFWHLIKKEWDFFFLVFIGPDRIQHIFWEENELLNYYKYLDDFLNSVVKYIEDNDINLMIVSDHGFTKIKKIVNINTFLSEESYLIKRKKSNFLMKMGISKEKITEKILVYFKLTNIYKKLPPIFLTFFKKSISGINPIYDFDLNISKAIMIGFGGIYIFEENEDFKEKIKKEIIQKIENLKNPDNDEKIIEKVFRREEIYFGKFLTNAPDLIILPKKGYSLKSAISKDIIEPPLFKIADHALDGIFLAYGPNIKKGQIINPKIYDIAPTILYMNDVPIPKDMDGKVLIEIFNENSEIIKKSIKYADYNNEYELIKNKIKKLKINGKI